jgi:hypothetical protein
VNNKGGQMIKIIGIVVALLGAILFALGAFGWHNITAWVIGALMFIIGVVVIIKG